jgi:hypothetical protein
MLEMLYDLGVRKDAGIVFWGVESMGTFIVGGDPEDTIFKREELAYGGLELFPAAFIGDLGEKVKNGLGTEVEVIEVTTSACFYYDAVLSAAFTFHQMMSFG